MSDETAARAVDFIYSTTPPGERIDIGFFGGEPLLHLDIVEKIILMVRGHYRYADYDIDMTIVTNATLLTGAISRKLIDWGMRICVSCDGLPAIQDRFRRFTDGSATSALVEKNLRLLTTEFPAVMVNAVYGPETVQYLDRTVDYLSSIGVRRIYLSPDYSARWSITDTLSLCEVYDAVGKRYCDYYRNKNPHYISLIDSKIVVILQDGYQKQERCLMGRGEFAVSPEGNLYPCERLVGDGLGNGHCIGNLETVPQPERMRCCTVPGDEVYGDCERCELRKYCMHWCGCSNFFATGYYNRVSELLCASERAAIQTAMNVMEELAGDEKSITSAHLEQSVSPKSGEFE
jgi:uncharacterized protein